MGDKKKVNVAHEVSLWKGIYRKMEWFKEAIAKNFGNGKDTIFWLDRWCRPGLLADEAPLLFNIAINKFASMYDNWNSDENPNSWNIQLMCALNDWEMDQMASLMGHVEHWNSNMQREDTRRWIPRKDGTFLVRSSYEILVNREAGTSIGKGYGASKLHLKFSFTFGLL